MAFDLSLEDWIPVWGQDTIRLNIVDKFLETVTYAKL